LKSTRVYVNANNLMTWSSLFKGIDPEQTSPPTNQEIYPLTRTINFGISLKF
jgi:hypothetical protein